MKFQPLTTTAVALLLPVAFSLPVMAQQVIGAKSGVIHYVEGDVFAADQKIETKLGAKFNELKENQVLRAEEGRAEVLLNPLVGALGRKHFAVLRIDAVGQRLHDCQCLCLIHSHHPLSARIALGDQRLIGIIG